MAGQRAPQQGGLRTLLRAYLRRQRPGVRRLAFSLHGVGLRVTTDREDTARSVAGLLGHAQRRRLAGAGHLHCHVYTEASDRPPVLSRFSDAAFLMKWETTGYFVWQDLCLIDFYPWATALIDPRHGVAVVLLNASEIPPPLIFSNQVFYQTLEVLLNARGVFPVHAAGVALGRRAALFPAPSGYGKTTLALTLVRAGYRYLGDDKPWIVRRAGRPAVLAFPEPINGYVDELRQFRHIPARAHPDFPPGFPLKTSFRVDAFWPGCVLPSAVPKALLFPEAPPGDPGAPVLIEPMPRVEGLRRLIELNWPMRRPWALDGFMDMMRDLAAHTPCYRMRCGANLEDLPERIERLLK
jgi:hypothetical protein